MHPSTFESFPVLLELNQFKSHIGKEALEFRMSSLSFELLIASERTLPAGLGSFLCNVKDGVLAISSMGKVHSMELSPNVGAFGFR